MKLAEAVINRKHCKEKIEALQFKLDTQILVKKDEVLEEDSYMLLERIEKAIQQQYELDRIIENTNSMTYLNDKYSLKDALIERTYLRKKCRVLEDIIIGMVRIRPRMRIRFKDEVQDMCATVNIAMIEKRLEEYKEMYNAIDLKIKAKNWEVDVIIK